MCLLLQETLLGSNKNVALHVWNVVTVLKVFSVVDLHKSIHFMLYPGWAKGCREFNLCYYPAAEGVARATKHLPKHATDFCGILASEVA